MQVGTKYFCIPTYSLHIYIIYDKCRILCGFCVYNYIQSSLNKIKTHVLTYIPSLIRHLLFISITYIYYKYLYIFFNSKKPYTYILTVSKCFVTYIWCSRLYINLKCDYKTHIHTSVFGKGPDFSILKIEEMIKSKLKKKFGKIRKRYTNTVSKFPANVFCNVFKRFNC